MADTPDAHAVAVKALWRAISGAGDGRDDWIWESVSDYWRPRYQATADAVLDAIGYDALVAQLHEQARQHEVETQAIRASLSVAVAERDRLRVALRSNMLDAI